MPKSWRWRGCGLALREVLRQAAAASGRAHWPGAFDIGLDDPAVGAGALDGGKVDALLSAAIRLASGEAITARQLRCCPGCRAGRPRSAHWPWRAARRAFDIGLDDPPAGAGAGTWPDRRPVLGQLAARAGGAAAQAAAGRLCRSSSRPQQRASSPSSASVAITVPTFTPSVPSATSIAAITPSSTASNSIVALSVSISAMMSPDLTVSPTLTSHWRACLLPWSAKGRAS